MSFRHRVERIRFHNVHEQVDGIPRKQNPGLGFIAVVNVADAFPDFLERRLDVIERRVRPQAVREHVRELVKQGREIFHETTELI